MRKTLAVISLALIALPAIAGDTFNGFSVECSSSAWTSVVPVRAQRRRVTAQVLDSNAGGVCISTTSAAGTACDDSCVGVELSTGTANITALDFLTRAALYCRARADLSAQRLKGFEAYDAQ